MNKRNKPTVASPPTIKSEAQSIGEVVLANFNRTDIELLLTLVQNANFPGKMAAQVVKLLQSLPALHVELPPLPE